MKNDFSTKISLVNRDDCLVNGRIKYIPDDDGEYYPYELTCFDRNVFSGKYDLERRDIKSKYGDFFLDDIDDELCSSTNDEENRRKSYNRARNNLFDLLMCTPSLNCFLTLTLDSSKIDRYDYTAVVKALGVWLDNRVRRNKLHYVLVPEFHKDGAVHFHGLCNFEALQVVRACNAHTGTPLSDDEGRPIFNIADYRFGFNTVIPLSGENARVATAKYCYKYITKSKGEKVGGRYYLSGGSLGRPRYSYVSLDYDSVEGVEMCISQANLKLKKLKL